MPSADVRSRPAGSRGTAARLAIGSAATIDALRVVLLTAAIGGPENGSTALRSPDTVAHYGELRAGDRRGRAAHAGLGAACHRDPSGSGEQRRVVRRVGLDLG